MSSHDPLVPVLDPDAARAGMAAARRGPGRPPIYKDPKVFPFRTEAKLVTKLDKRARRAGMTRNQLLNKIVSEYLDARHQ